MVQHTMFSLSLEVVRQLIQVCTPTLHCLHWYTKASLLWLPLCCHCRPLGSRHGLGHQMGCNTYSTGMVNLVTAQYLLHQPQKSETKFKTNWTYFYLWMRQISTHPRETIMDLSTDSCLIIEAVCLLEDTDLFNIWHLFTLKYLYELWTHTVQV